MWVRERPLPSDLDHSWYGVYPDQRSLRDPRRGVSQSRARPATHVDQHRSVMDVQRVHREAICGVLAVLVGVPLRGLVVPLTRDLGPNRLSPTPVLTPWAEYVIVVFLLGDDRAQRGGEAGRPKEEVQQKPGLERAPHIERPRDHS